MTALILLPTPMQVPRPTTTTHSFVGVSEAGRRVSIEVTAAVDVDAVAVYSDLRKSMPGISELGPAEDTRPTGVWGAIGNFSLVWVLIALGVTVLLAVLDIAGLHLPRFPGILPIVGDKDIGVGLMRLWLLGFPVCVCLIAMAHLLEPRKA